MALVVPAAPRSPLYRVLGLLDPVRQQGSGWEAHCPGTRHQKGDRHASLSIAVGSDGRVLLNCHAGCETSEILSRLGLTWDDLFERSAAGNPMRRFRLQAPGGRVVEHVREDRPDGKRLWWEADGKRQLGCAVADVSLYRTEHIIPGDPRPVVVCEGESATEAATEMGLLAVGTVTGADKTPSDAALACLQGREVWLWPDNDEIGRTHMARISERIQPAPRWIVWMDAPPKADAADFLRAGGTAEAVAALVRSADATRMGDSPRTGPRIWTADELARERFVDPKWAIPDLLPSGLTILAGRPKMGKSWLALGWAIDIPLGSKPLRRMKAIRGETLYLALEDGPRRIQERINLMLGEANAPAVLHVATEWARMDEGGLDLLDDWLTEHPECRLVVIDTFKRIRPREKNSQRLYDLDYDAIQPLAQLALAHNVAIVVVHHTRKGESSDPLEMVSGTLGLSGAADCVMVLRRERGQADASLFVTGRDVEEQDLALRWEKEDVLGWELLGDAEQFRRSRERQAVLDTITTMPGMSPSEIADALGRNRAGTKRLLFNMARDGDVRVRDGRYFPIVTAEANPANPANLANSENPAYLANGEPSRNGVRTVRPRSEVRPVRTVRHDGTNDNEEGLPWQ